MKREEYKRRMAEACPHGPEEPCTCDGSCGAEMCKGNTIGCTCDIAWDEIAELKDAWIED